MKFKKEKKKLVKVENFFNFVDVPLMRIKIATTV